MLCVGGYYKIPFNQAPIWLSTYTIVKIDELFILRPSNETFGGRG